MATVEKPVCKDLNKLAWLAAAAAAGVAAYFIKLRPWHRQWGTTEDEASGLLPGDELIPDGENVTHAITIDAPVDCVWPWIVQLGQDKGGFYSYTALENLVGCHMKNADTIHQEWQGLKVGDPVKFHPNAPTVPVAQLEYGSHLVLHGGTDADNEFTWAFIVRPLQDERSRLIIRLRARGKEGVANLMALLIEPAHFIMEQKMMRTIRDLAEDLAKSRHDSIDDE